MSAQFPNVPPFPGVPPLARQVAYAVTAAEVTVGGIQQLINIRLGLAANKIRFGEDLPDQVFLRGTLSTLPSYGFFQVTTQMGTVTLESTPGFEGGDDGTYNAGTFNANAVLQPDSVMEFTINADSTINSHPIEQGGFEAYNRVQEPISIRMLLACQGKNMSQTAFVSTLQSLREGTTVLTISTPDASYPNMVLKGFGYKKTSDRGFVTIWADTQWQEERSTNVTVSAPPTVQPQGAATSNLGSLQAVVVTAKYMAIINNPPVAPAPLPLCYASTAPPSGNCF